jgi:hypothetical protein
MPAQQPPAVPGVFLDHLDASITQALQIASAADQLVVRASLIALARIARETAPHARNVWLREGECSDGCDSGCDCAPLVVTGSFGEDDQAARAMQPYAANLWAGNNGLWLPHVTDVSGTYKLDIDRALAIPQPDSRLGYTRGEVKYGAGQTPGQGGQPSPTRYFPIDFTEKVNPDD